MAMPLNENAVGGTKTRHFRVGEDKVIPLSLSLSLSHIYMALQPFGPWPLFQFLNPINSG
jgi:hypothetical protein